jgi:hypothetical protein
VILRSSVLQAQEPTPTTAVRINVQLALRIAFLREGSGSPSGYSPSFLPSLTNVDRRDWKARSKETDTPHTTKREVRDTTNVVRHSVQLAMA